MWYQQPIRPLDPVIEDDPQTGAIRYIRDSFIGTGQDSFTQPPAQDQSQWQALTNVLPITDGSLRRRWPIGLLNANGPTITGGITRLYSFQRDADLSRRLIGASNSTVFAVNEDGSTANASIFTPALTPRAVVSRSSAYFFSGASADSKKWDGTNVTNWGIDIAATSVNGSFGPQFAATATDIGSNTLTWTNLTNIKADDGNFATVTNSTNGTALSHVIQLTGFGFAASGTISGIKVEVKAKVSTANGSGLVCQLVKAGVATGISKGTPSLTTTSQYYAMGNSSDSWGAAWTSSDINNANFGVLLTADVNPGVTLSVDAVRITVYGNAPVITFTTGAGAVTLTIGRVYYFAFKNSNTGHYSDLSDASNSTGAQTSKQMTLTLPQPIDTQVDTVVVLATADGGDPSILYQVAEVPKGTTSYVDNTPETTLNLNQQLVFTDANHTTFGLALNTPPPLGKLCIKHKGRLWMAVGQNLYFSKSIGDLTLPNGFIAGIYEEAWPASNFFDISQGAETVNGLLSDGQVLYIGTQSHIRRVLGDDITNFQEPEILHPGVGVLNQEVWQLVYMEGTPMGAIWLTPDNRVVVSDGNTVGDIGKPIQDVINNINTSATYGPWAMFVANGQYDLYILALPQVGFDGPNLLCIYDIRTRRWTVWNPTLNPWTAGLFNITATGAPQWLTAREKFGNASVFFIDFTYNVIESASPIITTAQTSWMHLGAPTYHKLLDEIEVIGDSAGLTVTVEGASTQADFAAPHTVVSNVPLTASPFGQFKAYLATATTQDRYYRFTFMDSGSAVQVLNGFNVRAVPFNTL